MDYRLNLSSRRGFRLFAVLALIGLLTGLACNVTTPNPSQPTATASQNPQPITAPTAAPTPLPTKVPQNLPAAVVETSPLPNSEISLKQPFILYFNQPMEKGSVEAALQSQPAVAGSFKWLNDYTVSFTPDQPLPKDTAVTVSISTQARAANGLAMVSAVELPYHTAAGFQAISRLPLPDVNNVDPTAAVVVTFDHPIVALGDSSQAPAAFSLEPAANGRGLWLNTSTYIFYPDPGLSGGKKYTVHLNPDLKDPEGLGWAATPLLDWSFTTLAPMLIQVAPDNLNGFYLDSPVTLTFNVGMDPDSFTQNFTFTAPDGKPVEGKFTWTSKGTEVTFKPLTLLQRGQAYKMILSGKALARGGTPLGADVSWRVTTVPDMAVTGTDLAGGQGLNVANGFGNFRIMFTSPLPNNQDMNKYFTLDPAIANFNAYGTTNGTDVFISGMFAGSTDYTLRVSSNLADQWGQHLKEDFILKFRTGPLQPSLVANIVDGMYNTVFLTPTENSIPAQATNIKSLSISTGAISLADFASAAELSGNQRSQKFTGRGVTFSKTPGLAANKNVPYALPLTSDGKGLKPGLYFYTVTSPQLTQAYPGPETLLLVVSKIELTMKVSATEVTVWAVDLDSSQPLAGARISIYEDNKGNLASLGDLMTDGSGLGTLAVPNRTDNYNPLVAVAGKPGDANFSFAFSNWTSGMGANEFGYSSRIIDNQPIAYLYTDRPIYRPGQVVDYRVILRQANNGRYALTNQNKLNLRVYGQYDPLSGVEPLITTIPVNLTEYGAGSGSFTLPASVPPGYFHMELAEISGSYLGFQVADYRKPEIDLQVTFAKTEQLAKQEVTGSVKASYYFGAPGANLDFDWTLVSHTTFFDLPGDYQTGKFDPNTFMPSWYSSDFGSGTFIANGSGTTDQNGSAAISISKEVMAKAFKGNKQELQLEVTLRNQGDFPVSARATQTLHPANDYIGIRLKHVWSGQANQQAGFSVLTVDWQGKPAAARPLHASFQQATWTETPGWNISSNQPPFTISYAEVASTNFTTDAQGAARIAFTPPKAGTYLVDVSEGDAGSQVFFWVGGEGSVAWPALPNQQVRIQADRSEYLAGQTAKIFIPNPLGSNALALVTVERSKVMQSSVVSISGSSDTLDFPISESYAPNVYISVTLLGKNDQGRPDYRVGYLMVKVKPAAEVLNVELTSLPQQVAPTGALKFGIKVTDSKGQPVQGEFSLAVVDKAILALADPNAADIMTAFYGTQMLGVSSSTSLAVYSGRLAPIQPGGRGGGGGLTAPPSVRQNFADTAFWSGSVQTDANGAADVTLKLPDNLTTWVITLRGLTKDTRVGEAVKEVVATKDLLIRPVTPRFLVAGDHIQLAAMVHNNTPNALSVSVALQATGVDLDDPTQSGQKVDVAANSLARVTWWVKVQDTDKVDLQFIASSGSLQDAATPEMGSVTVKTYSTPQSYGTSGILAQAGEQLEVVSVPRSFTPTGGSLQVELTSSLAGAIVEGLQAMDIFPSDFTEPVMSRLLPNLETLILLQKNGIDATDLKSQLNQKILEELKSILDVQNKDGGWGWGAGHESDPYLSAYVLYGLGRAAQAGFTVDADALARGLKFGQGALFSPTATTKGPLLDQLAFQVYALQVAGVAAKDAGGLYGVVQHLSPWAKAMLALTLELQNKSDPHIKEIVSDLEGKAVRSATGAFWEAPGNQEVNYASANFTSAVVLAALAHFDPTSNLVADAVRYLVAHRLNNGCWASSYESAWALVALGEAMQGTGDLKANFAFSASLNDAVLLKGQAGAAASLTPAATSVPLSTLDLTAPNALKLIHEAGDGRLYYRAFLKVDRPVESAEAMQNGISIERAYFLAAQDCRAAQCQPVAQASLSASNPTLLVRLTVTVPHDMNSVVVEDFIPAGAEIVNLALKTSQQVLPNQQQAAPVYDPSDPFLDGWGSWYFSSPAIFDDHIRWVAATLPAGSYQLTYRLTPLQAGEFRLIPAHAYQYYFPDEEGSTAGSVFKIVP